MSKSARNNENKDKSRTNGIDTFVKNNFIGSKEDWQQLDDEIRTAVRATSGVRGVRYLFTDWPDDICDDEEFLDRDILGSLSGVATIEEPDPAHPGVMINVPVTYEMRKERREINEDSRKHNERVGMLKSEIFQILASRVGSDIKTKFAELEGDPVLCYRYLEFTYGPNMLGPQEHGEQFLSFILIEMEADERFANFIVKFERKMTMCNASEMHACGVLQSDGTNRKKIQCLPDRLLPELAYARSRKMGYQATKRFESERQEERSKSLKSVSKVLRRKF